MSIGIGSTIWRFDENRRKYTPPPERRLIYREHWHEIKIISENRRSWVCGYEKTELWKVPKTGPHPGFVFSLAEVDDDCWVNDHAYKIGQVVGRCDNADTLRKIAALIGWEPLGGAR